MIILGIDPGYAIVGVGVVCYEGGSFRPLEYDVITTPAGIPLPDRLCRIDTEINRFLDKYNPDAFAIDELFFNSNTTTAIAVAQARGVLIAAAARRGVPIYEYTPLQIKQAITGYGRADKNQMQNMVKMILRINHIPRPDDAADALAVAICHGNSCKMNRYID